MKKVRDYIFKPTTTWEYDKLSYVEKRKKMIPNEFLVKCFGLTKTNETVCVVIEGFYPYIYVELPDNDIKNQPIRWNKASIADVKSCIISKLTPREDDIQNESNLLVENIEYIEMLTMKHYTTKKKKLFKISLLSHDQVSDAKNRIIYWINKEKNGHHIPSLGTFIRFTICEDWIDSLIKFMSVTQLSPVSWKKISQGSYRTGDNKLSTCKHEIWCNYKDIKDIKPPNVTVSPTFLSFDIETFSSRFNDNISAYPNAFIRGDEIYMISCVFHKLNSNEYKKYLICDRPCNRIGDDIKLVKAKDEVDLLMKFQKLVLKLDPDILLGHNILGYDLKYMANRAGNEYGTHDMKAKEFMGHSIWSEFSVLGRLKDISTGRGRKCSMIVNNWSSGAYKGMNFNYIDINGRLIIDTYPYVKRTYPNLENFKLDYISEKFLGEHKHDVSYEDQFKMYLKGKKKDMAKIGRYCTQDTMLPLKLVYKLNIWIDLNEIAEVVGIPIFELYTRGQGRRGLAQIYRRIYKNHVIDLEEIDENIEYDEEGNKKEPDKYHGAYVVEPNPGLYENVICMDFGSLYPSMIRAYNFDFTTYVREDDKTVPDSMCNIVEWTEKPTKKKKSDPEPQEQHFRHRFIKAEYHKGVIPSILDEFTEARSIAKKEMNKYMKPDSDGQPLEGFEVEFASANSKQRELKVSSNSAYGLMGAKKGKMSLLPGATSTTAKGRESIKQVIDYILKKYESSGANLVYGDTDSAMFTFSSWDFKRSFMSGSRLAEEISLEFPKPMILNFEKIFKTFLIFKKKNYVGFICNKEGEIIQTMTKGIMLARRDYCKFAKAMYKPTIDTIINRVYEGKLSTISEQMSLLYEVTTILHDKIKSLMSNQVSLDDLMIRRSWNPNTVKVVQTEYGPKEIHTYKKELAHDSLVHRMMNNGYNFEPGDIVYYVFTEQDGKTKQADLVENPKIHQDLATQGLSKINYIYYLEHQVKKPITELLSLSFKGFKYNHEETIRFLKDTKERKKISKLKKLLRITKNQDEVKEIKRKIRNKEEENKRYYKQTKPRYIVTERNNILKWKRNGIKYESILKLGSYRIKKFLSIVQSSMKYEDVDGEYDLSYNKDYKITIKNNRRFKLDFQHGNTPYKMLGFFLKKAKTEYEYSHTGEETNLLYYSRYEEKKINRTIDIGNLAKKFMNETILVHWRYSVCVGELNYLFNKYMKV